MKGATAVLLAWACLQLLLGAGLAVWSGGTPSLLLIGGGLPIVAFAVWHQLRARSGGPRLVPRVSLPTALLAVGLSLLAAGLTAGLWLVLIGAELSAIALVWLGRELRDERRLRR